MVLAIEPMVNAGGPEVLLSAEDGWTARTRDGSRSASRSRRPHSVTRTNASLTIEPLILLLPSVRSAKVIGTSTTRAPERTARQAQSTWKQ